MEINVDKTKDIICVKQDFSERYLTTNLLKLLKVWNILVEFWTASWASLKICFTLVSRNAHKTQQLPSESINLRNESLERYDWVYWFYFPQFETLTSGRCCYRCQESFIPTAILTPLYFMFYALFEIFYIYLPLVCCALYLSCFYICIGYMSLYILMTEAIFHSGGK